MSPLVKAIADAVSEVRGVPFAPKTVRQIGGGCINQALSLHGATEDVFVKHNRSDRLATFRAEAAGLEVLAAAHAVRVPNPICFGAYQGAAFLAMEYITFGRGGEQTMELLGRQLARLHRVTSPTFGWEQSNTIGTTAQVNAVDTDWVAFWCRNRLGHQLQLAARNGYDDRLQTLGEQLLGTLGVLFAGYQPYPSLLHGDLWFGNFAADTRGRPVIFDPAIYFGDREADIAMTELFGGFGARFYAAYQEDWPLDPGYRVRRTLYNLYHVLNHLNLFGGGYRSQAESMLNELLSEL